MNEFIRMSRYAGMREDLIQASGGNSSYKVSAEKMLIKASGYQLADITAEQGYAVINPQIIRTAFLQMPSMDEFDEQTSKQILDSAFVVGRGRLLRPSYILFQANTLCIPILSL